MLLLHLFQHPPHVTLISSKFFLFYCPLLLSLISLCLSAVGGHSMNERSSRSHSCIRITITGENLDKGTMINSKLYLIDLAGSERIAKTDATVRP